MAKKLPGDDDPEYPPELPDGDEEDEEDDECA